MQKSGEALRKSVRSGTLKWLSISVSASFKSTRPPGRSDPETGSAPGAAKSPAWRNMSLRHVSLREMGWSRKPYEFRIRPAKPESKGKATHGSIRKYAFLASHKTIFFERGCSLRMARGLFNAAVCARQLYAGRTHG